jgi:serine O-acetyltransferase
MQTTPSNPIHQLHQLRREYHNTTPTLNMASKFIDGALGVLFPHFSAPDGLTLETLEALSSRTNSQLKELCAAASLDSRRCEEIANEFRDFLPALHTELKLDAEGINRGDPAARSVDEVIVAYPGFYAISVYRIANWLLKRQVPIVPRLITECAHRVTGIDIHPGATIGSSFVIDHGTGIVIGETTVIEENVKMYQGVTLGALSVDKDLADKKRHPTIEKDVVIYANATILGGNTVIGAGTIVGGNVWITASIPPKSRVYHKADTVISTQVDVARVP